MKIVNLKLDQGATWDVAFPPIHANDAPADLTGFLARSQARTSYADPTITASFATLLDPATRIISFHHPAASTSNITAATLVFDVEIYRIVASEEIVYRPYGGPLQVLPEVTRGESPVLPITTADFSYEDGSAVIYNDDTNVSAADSATDTNIAYNDTTAATYNDGTNITGG